jgi:hypothetical protein
MRSAILGGDERAELLQTIQELQNENAILRAQLSLFEERRCPTSIAAQAISWGNIAACFFECLCR